MSLNVDTQQTEKSFKRLLSYDLDPLSFQWEISKSKRTGQADELYEYMIMIIPVSWIHEYDTNSVWIHEYEHANR